jgi:hypothetical protein
VPRRRLAELRVLVAVQHDEGLVIVIERLRVGAALS